MSAARAPRPALAILTAFATLAVTATADISPEPPYLTILHKGESAAELNEVVGPLYIPKGQCSGVLDQLLECQNGEAPRAVRTLVRDYSLARIALDDDLHRSSVLRANCEGEALVHVRLACGKTPFQR